MDEHINQVFMDHITKEGLGPLIKKGMLKIMSQGQIEESDRILVFMDIGGRLFSVKIHEILPTEGGSIPYHPISRINQFFDNDCG